MSDNKGKIIVVCAPSGSGKSTIINRILDTGDLDLQFSISATNRAPREGEKHGIHYYFMTTEDFRAAIANNEFVEWEQVYPGRYYGTLRSQVLQAADSGHNVILDIDVKGAMSVKQIFGDRALTIFIKAPSIDDLRARLIARGTDKADVIAERISKAEYELGFAPQMDAVVVNSDIDKAVADTRKLITDFIDR
ncbi:MAG: guanylate kinase [Muribaculaceae bacterium]|nr:guanylate kinase [Muribaculaceae bacterium]